MIRVPRERPFSYGVPSEARQCRFAPTVHEPRPSGVPDCVPSAAPAAPSARATPTQRLPLSSTSRVRLHLKPGQKGTKQLLEQYGDRLVCVRYRYDAERKKRFKTVELLVAERDWEPPLPRVAPDQILKLRVAFVEAELRDRVKRAGGTWNPEQRIWQLRYDRAVALGLNGRIVDDLASNGGCASSSGGSRHADAGTPSR